MFLTFGIGGDVKCINYLKRAYTKFIVYLTIEFTTTD